MTSVVSLENRLSLLGQALGDVLDSLSPYDETLGPMTGPELLMTARHVVEMIENGDMIITYKNRGSDL